MPIAAAPAFVADDERPSCLTTVVLTNAILDFEAFVVVVGSKRHFLPVHLFWIAAALMFAAGEEVPITLLAPKSRNVSAPNGADLVGRDIRQLRRKLLCPEAGMLVSRTVRGYRLDHVPKQG